MYNFQKVFFSKRYFSCFRLQTRMAPLISYLERCLRTHLKDYSISSMNLVLTQYRPSGFFSYPSTYFFNMRDDRDRWVFVGSFSFSRGFKPKKSRRGCSKFNCLLNLCGTSNHGHAPVSGRQHTTFKEWPSLWKGPSCYAGLSPIPPTPPSL